LRNLSDATSQGTSGSTKHLVTWHKILPTSTLFIIHNILNHLLITLLGTPLNSSNQVPLFSWVKEVLG